MKLENISKRTYQHSILNKKKQVELIELKPGQVKDIPDDIAKQWLLSGEVREYVKPAEAKAEKEALEKENAKLKAELEKLKTDSKKLAEAKAEKEANKK